MKVSIITPSFNRAKFIEETIESVLTQDYPHIEYLIIDGKSNDGTVDILEKYKKGKKLKYISESDEGMYDAINKGLKMSTGDILAYLNTDDRYFPWTVKEVMKVFVKRSDVDLIYGDSMVVNSNEKYPQLNIYPQYSKFWLKGGAIIAQPTVFFRRKVFNNVGDFAKDVTFIADCEYWLRAIEKKAKLIKLNEFLAIEYNHPETLRNKYMLEIEREKAFLLSKYNSIIFRNSFLRKCLLRLKYIEKEYLSICFMLNSKKCYWVKFRKGFDVKSNFKNYICNKIFRDDNNVWTVARRDMPV